MRDIVSLTRITLLTLDPEECPVSRLLILRGSLFLHFSFLVFIALGLMANIARCEYITL